MTAHPTIAHFYSRFKAKRYSRSLTELTVTLPAWARHNHESPDHASAFWPDPTPLREAFARWSNDDLVTAYETLCKCSPPQPPRPDGIVMLASRAARAAGDEQLARLWELWMCEVNLIAAERRRRLEMR